ncbi:MAG: hypothetical protein AB7P07_02390 [Hyphomonadaceae bacterium]
MSETPPPVPPPAYRPRKRLPIETQRIGAGSNVRRTGVVIYAILVLMLAGMAFYMGAIERHPLTSPYVAGPAVGAAWFALRLFMTLAPRA